jgi:hypothetical protein
MKVKLTKIGEIMDTNVLFHKSSMYRARGVLTPVSRCSPAPVVCTITLYFYQQIPLSLYTHRGASLIETLTPLILTR